MSFIKEILASYGLHPDDYRVEKIGTGHIHQTFKLTGAKSYILQKINTEVFKKPEIIGSNLNAASDYLRQNFPDYYFPSAIRSKGGKEMEYDSDGSPWRLFNYTKNTVTIDRVNSEQEAYEAARGFAQLTRCLDKVDISKFSETIPQFHDLNLRFSQFNAALSRATELNEKTRNCIKACQDFSFLVDQYNELLKGGALRLRITHNDTKINNVLFDRDSRKTVSVIDLDTLMPGYFIYDLGDMVRTFVSPVDEEESDYSKIIFRNEIYTALMEGYLSQMGDVLSADEKVAIPIAGKMMTYIMALRFLTDYLNGNIYYHTKYPEQNLIRAGNQLCLLEIINQFVRRTPSEKI